MKMIFRSLILVATLHALLLHVPLLGLQLAALAQGNPAINIISADDSDFPRVRFVMTADQGGVPLTDVEARELRVEESGTAAVPISVQLATDSSLPLALVVVLDISGSMEEGGTLARAQAAANSLINSLAPVDTAAVVSFADNVTVVQPFTSDKRALTAAVSSLQIDGATALYDAVGQSAQLAASSGRQRRAVVILTDGEESGGASSLDRDGSLAVAARSTVPFYAVGVGFDFDQPYLEGLATRTRGRFFPAFQGSDIPAVYASLAELLRSQLNVTVQSGAPADLADRSLSVTLSRGPADATAELSYHSQRAAALQADESSADGRQPDPGGGGINPLVLAGLLGLLIVGALMIGKRSRRGLAAADVVADEEPLVQSVSDEPVVHVGGFTPTASSAALQVVEGPEEWRGRLVEIGEAPVTLGTRPGCAIHLPEHPEVAGEHVRLWARDGKLMLHHLARGATTSVAGHAVTWASMAAGDEMVVGPYRFRCTGAVARREPRES